MRLSYNLAILWMSVAFALAVCLPLATRIGPRVRGGAITVVSVAALVASALFGWALYAMAQVEAYAPGTGLYPYNANGLNSALVIGGALLLAAWIMAFSQAIRTHHWGWRALLPLGVCAVILAIYGVFVAGVPYSAANTVCPFVSTNPELTQFCSPRTPVAVVVLAVVVLGPVVTLIYALLHPAQDGGTLTR